MKVVDRECRKRAGTGVCCVLLAVMFWGLAFFFSRAAVRENADVHVYYKTEVCTQKEIEEFRRAKTEQGEADVPLITGWQEQENTIIKSEYRETQDGQLLQIAGSMRPLFSGSLVQGNYPWEEDLEGCLVSTALAKRLFGAETVQGNALWIENQRYIVRGVVKNSREFVAVNAEEDLGLSNLILEDTENSQPASQVRELCYQMTGTYPDGVFEGRLYGGIVRLLLAVPLWGVGMVCFHRLYKKLKTISRFELRLLAKAVGIALFCFLCWEGLGASLRFSGDYLPSMWSDMGFFPQLIKEKMQDFRDLKEFFLCPADRAALESVWKTGAAILGCLAAGVYGKKGCCSHLRCSQQRIRSILSFPTAGDRIPAPILYWSVVA